MSETRIIPPEIDIKSIAPIATIAWRDIEAASRILPELEEATLTVIRKHLKYEPGPASRLQFEPFLRALVASHRQGAMSNMDFYEQAEAQVMLIRNADVSGPWTDVLHHDAEAMRRYAHYIPQHVQAARERLSRFLGYEPDIDHSYEAELRMRELMAEDIGLLPDFISRLDLKLLTIIKYREVLLKAGRAAANASPLLDVRDLKNIGFKYGS